MKISLYLRKDIDNPNFWIYENEIETSFPHQKAWERLELDWEQKVFTVFHIKLTEEQKIVKTKTQEKPFETVRFKIMENLYDDDYLVVYMFIDDHKIKKTLCKEDYFTKTKENYVEIRKEIEPFVTQFPDIRIDIDIQEKISLEDHKFLRYSPHHTLIYNQSYEDSVRYMLLIGMAFISFVSLIFILSSQGIQLISLLLWLISMILVNGFVWKTQFQDQETFWEIDMEEKILTIKTTKRQLLAPPHTTEVSTPLTKIYFSTKREREVDSEGLFLEYRTDLYLSMEAENLKRIDLLAGNFYDSYRITAEEKVQEYVSRIAPNIELF